MTRRLLGAGLALTTALGLSACTGSRQAHFFQDKDVPAGSFHLVAFDSCDTALSGLRSAAKAVVGPYGFQLGGLWTTAEGGVARDMAGGAPPPQAAAGDKASGSGGSPTAPDYSGTNTHEAGVDEPDLVKTDGRRIVTVSGGVLRVIDAASRTSAGRLSLAGDGQDDLVRYAPADLLLSGDHALVLLREHGLWYGDPGGPMPADGREPAKPVGPRDVLGPRLVLVDLSGSPRVLSTYTIDGSLVDARQVGGTARVVVRSGPRLTFPHAKDKTVAQLIKDNRRIIDRAGVDEWLPRFSVTTDGRTQKGRIDCASVHRPASYTGTSMLTVLSFDLNADKLGQGDGVTVVADGDTVYSNGPSLYVASESRWRAIPTDGIVADAPGIAPAVARTEIYRFKTEEGERPSYAGGGSVPGYLINQYAMSEWDGRLRVATTSAEARGDRGQPPKTQSAVYVLAPDGRKLKQVGQVAGLGKGERIYSVRFTGPIAYVVTFRQTDPLYTVDLSDPAQPRVRGELKITGYSSYLHPAGGTRLIGIGQEASQQGRTQGTQVSLFDVADPANPTRLAQYHLAGAHSEAEFDPHAFLYWPSDGLLVVPLQVYQAVDVPPGPGGDAPMTSKPMPSVGALVLKVSDNGIDEVGFLTHPAANTPNNPGYPAQIRRSLMVGDTLWTVSDGGILASDPTTLARLAWLPF